MITCRHCGDEFRPLFGKPGYRDECTNCLSPDVPLYLAEQGEDDSGVVGTMTLDPNKIRTRIEIGERQ